jgi:uncharacterized membrane protein
VGRPSAALLAFLTTTTLALAAVVGSASLLPEVVPLHFGVAGEADDWGTRSSAVVFLTVVTAGLAALFALLAWATPKIPWEWVNLPGKERWTELGRREEVRRRLRADLLWLGAATSVLNIAVTLSILVAARSGSGRLPTWFFLAFVTWLGVIAVYSTYMYRARYRAPVTS